MSDKLNKRKWTDIAITKPEFGVIAVVAILIIIIGSLNSGFFEPANLNDILRNTSYSFIIAAPITLLMMSGGMDLTIGAVTSMGGVVAATCLMAGLPEFVAILAALLAGALVGFIKAIFVVSAGLMPFVATLGMRYVIDGAILVYTRGDPTLLGGNVSNGFRALGQGNVFGIYWSVILAAVVGIVFQVILGRTRYGREVCAVGGNEETARLAGINVNKTRYIINILVSVMAALVGVIYASRFNSAQPTIGNGTEMTIMASTIIGGASTGGGTGSLFGTFLGTLLLALIRNGLVLIGVSSFWQNLVFGAVLVLSLYVDKIRRDKSGMGA